MGAEEVRDTSRQAGPISAEEFFADWERKPWEPRIANGRLRRHAVPRLSLTPDESRAMVAAACATADLRQASGKLEVLGPRHWRFHPGQAKILEYLRIHGND